MALNEKRESENTETHKTTSNVRQLPSQHQNQILSALDTLGAKLVRSETERETMRRLLNEALDAQERLENQLERSHIDIQRRMDKLDQNATLPEETQNLLDEHAKTLSENTETLHDYNDRQIRLEDKLRDSQHVIEKLQRRIDTQEQKRAKLQRRIERVENIAADAQNALESKALVLLADHSQHVQALPHIDATAPMQALNDLHQNNDPAGITTSSATWWKNPFVFGLSLCCALGLGWIAATSISSNHPTYFVMQDGTLAPFSAEKDAVERKTQTQVSEILGEENIEGVAQNDIVDVQPETVDEEIAQFAVDLMIAEILDEALIENEMDEDALAVEVSPVVADPLLTMDRDLTLPDDIKAIEEKAFQNIPEAQHDLASLYTIGEAGVTQNYERAAYWFKQSAAQGIANAAYNLGVLYHQGLGQKQDMDLALDWYRRAAQLGHPEAQYNLGIAYIEGISTRYNPNMAAAFFQRAALGGIAEAAYNLGLILENGLLGEVRVDDALRWYRGAAEKGSLEAERALSALATRLGRPESESGYLDNGGTVSRYMDSANADQDYEVAEEINLGSLVPSREQIRIAQIQEQLRKMKYYNGPQDGIVGSGTIKAIKSYQIREGLPADGQATESLLSHMLSNEALF